MAYGTLLAAALLSSVANFAAAQCTRPSSVTDTEYGTITEADLAIATFDVTLACAGGYSSTGSPTAVACTSDATDYTVTAPCAGASCTAL
jgi:short subunit dehydrogenase-like uncharacterized protein